MNLYIAKILVFILLVLFRLLSGIIPLLISKRLRKGTNGTSRVEKWVSYSMDFSGGILLATTFIHMIPEVHEQLENANKKYNFPFSEAIVCIGFFIVYTLEELVKYFLHGHYHRHHHFHHNENIEHGGKLKVEKPLLDHTGKCDKNEKANATEDSNLLQTATTNNQSDDKLASSTSKGFHENNNKKVIHNGNNLKHILLVAALSFHSVVEGVAIGLARNSQELGFLFLAVMLHECTIILCVGMELVANCTSPSVVLRYIATLALVSPFGVLVGTGLHAFINTNSLSSDFSLIAILQGLAAGTILYVTFFEVLSSNKHHHHHGHSQNKHKDSYDHHSESGLPKLAFITMGFIFMVCLQVLTGHEHSHEQSSLYPNLSVNCTSNNNT